MGTVNNDIKSKSRESAKKAKQFSPSVQYAICQVLPNIRNGAFWGFTDMKDVESHIEAIKQDSNITARKLGNACLIEVNPNYLLQAVQAIDANAITQKDIAVIQQSMAEAKIDFEKLLIRKGKAEGGFGGTVGIYCTNDTTTISYKGVNYPAFRLAIADTLTLLNKYRYLIQVGNDFISPAQAGQSGQALWDAIKLSPTKTGTFINIRSTLSPEQMKALEKEFKQTYGLK